MSNLLVIAHSYPQPDEASGDLRFFTLLSLLARKHQIVFCAVTSHGTTRACNKASAQLEQIGIAVGQVNLLHVLQHFKPDIVWFEFYHEVRTDFLGLFERYCPYARIVVDSVDVHFNRLESRAKLTGKPEDAAEAKQVKKQELEAYANASMVIAVSEDDKRLIQQELPDMRVEIIPNIHVVPSFPDHTKRCYGELVFVGGFKHGPNLDAMLYFCKEILPRITHVQPQARLKIIGSNVPPAIQALANEHIDVLGYVPATAPYLQSAYISVAPLRYGGGMKGKVGEAMSYGLPVVTTSFGAEGFGLNPGKDLLVGDDAESFAAQVIALLNEPSLHTRIARGGYDFIKQHYSVPAVERLLDSVMQRLVHLPPRELPFHRKLTLGMKRWYTRNIAWRFMQP